MTRLGSNVKPVILGTVPGLVSSSCIWPLARDMDWLVKLTEGSIDVASVESRVTEAPVNLLLKLHLN